MGVAVHRQDLAGKKGTIAIETRNWASGVYTAKIIGRNGENLGVSKLVIVK
jgi:membrane carboxypeptidase/penicillin-binding protein